MTDETPITDRDLALPPDEPRIGDADPRATGDGQPSNGQDAPATTPQAARSAGVTPPAATPPPEPGDGGGDALALEDDGLPSTEAMREAMKAVMDPEIGYNVVDLGLLYDIEKDDEGNVEVTMTLTTMGCPLTELIHQQVSVVVGSLPGVQHVDVEFTFSPPWSPAMMSDEVRDELRAMGMNV